MRALPFAEMVEQVIERENVARVVGLAPEDYPRPAAHPGRRVPVAIHVQLVAVDRTDENALVLRAGKHPLWEKIVPGAEATDILVSSRSIVEIEQRRGATFHHRADQAQRERIGVAADVRPEMLGDEPRHAAER